MSEWVITSSVLILLIVGIRYCFRNKIAQQVRYALWLVVAVRLLIPFSFLESSFSVLNYFGWDNIWAESDEMSADNGAEATGAGAFIADEGVEDVYGTSDGMDHDADGVRQTGLYSGDVGSLRSESASGRERAELPNHISGQEEGQFADQILSQKEKQFIDLVPGQKEGKLAGRIPDQREEQSAGQASDQGERWFAAQNAGQEEGQRSGLASGQERELTAGQGSVLVEEPFTGRTPDAESGMTVESAVRPELEDGTENIRKRQGIPESLKTLLLIVWLLGAAVLAGIVALANGNYRRKVYMTRTRYRTEGKTVLPVYLSPAVKTPCMFGIFSPAVYLTQGIEGDRKAIRYVLCHEYTHYRHRDNLWSLVRVACVCLHWYNPLVWAAAVLSRQDCELACDERTLQLLREEERIDYGRTLLDFSVQQEILPGGLQLSTAVAGGKKQLKERLMMIVGHPRRTAGSLAMTMALVLLVTAFTFTGKVNGQELTGSEDVSGNDMAVSGEKYGSGAGGFAEGISDGGTGDFAGNGTAERRNAGKGSIRNTSIVAIRLNDGEDYTLKAGGVKVENSGEYRVDQLEFNKIYDKKEQTLQTIRLEDVKVLYTVSMAEVRANDGQMWTFSSEKEALFAKPLYTAEQMSPDAAGAFRDRENGADLSELFAGGIYAADLNFDGCQDFYLQGRSSGENTPYYCYLWNRETKAFEPAYMIPNLYVNGKTGLLESATREGNVHSVKYYRFDESNILHMVRYTEENQSPDAVFSALDLTYCEAPYALPAVDEWDYGAGYGGALTERYVRIAKNALEELYEWSGAKVNTACFSVTSFGEVNFGNKPQDLDASRIYYYRCYGEAEGFEDCIQQMGLSTERVVWYSPVTQWKRPEGLDQMTQEELVRWYFERSPLTKGEEAETITGDNEDDFTIKTASGNYYTIYLQPTTRELGNVYGPYEGRPVH